MPLTDQQIERWRQFREGMFADETFMKANRQRDAERRTIIPQMTALLADYVDGRIDNNEFRTIFQQKTASDWRSFGLNGFSGAMFLNMLTNNVPDQIEVARQLKATLPAPESIDDAYNRLESFMDFLQGLIQGKVAKRKLQPAHAPFFVSAWWHVQDPQQWPIYYISGRNALTGEGIYAPIVNQPVADYFAFRDVLLSLMEKLELDPWAVEQLCVWIRERKETSGAEDKDDTAGSTVSSTAAAVDRSEDNETKEAHGAIYHTQIQLLLAQIGRKLGCNVWIARDNHNKVWNGERLGDYSLGALPPYIVADPIAQRIIEVIDVLWLKGTRGVAAAFEIEHTTSIYSGLLRMSDLMTLQPNLAFPLYVVTSEARIKEVRKQLSRPTFQTLQLHENCGFFAYEELIREAPNIMRWGKSPELINDLAEYVPTVYDQ